MAKEGEGGRGGQGFSSFDLLKGDGRGRGLIVSYKFIMGARGGGGGGVGFV
jgi:hypothetical protein